MTTDVTFELRASLRGARAAVVFLTRIPAGGFPYTEREWAWSSGWFPWVGLVLACAMSAAWKAFGWAGPTVSALLTLGTGLLLTGALHEDGLADTADALGGAPSRERLFAILKDSRIGTYGALALVSSIALRAALYVQLGAAMPRALFLSEVLSRTAPVWLMWRLPYVTPEGGKSQAVCQTGVAQVALASLWPTLLIGALVCLRLISWQEIALAVGAACVTTALCGGYFRARAGGITGDFLGANQQLCGGAVLLSMVFSMSAGR